LAEPDLPAWVGRAQKGDRAAFEKIVQCTARVVYAQVVAVIRDRQKAEDLVQETYVSAWKGIGNVQVEEGGTGMTGSGVVGWLRTVARNATLDALKFEGRRKRWGGRAVLEAGAVVDDRPGPAESAELVESREQALRVLEELPEEYRGPLAMRYLAGADYETIRGALGLSDGALRGVLCRGMAMMRERMSKLEK